MTTADLKRASINDRIARRRQIVRWILCIITFAIAILYFFPLFYMFLTGFKTEIQAVQPALIFTPTLETYIKVLGNADMYGFLSNSIFQVIAGTLLSLAFGVPAAFAIAFGKYKKRETNDKVYFWFLTTILLPPVAVLIPLYIVFQQLDLNTTAWGLTILYVGFHIPIVVWMTSSFFKEIPLELLEASEIDGCTRPMQLWKIVMPLARNGIITAGLMVAVFIWNEFFLGFNLTMNTTATLPVYLARFREQQGQFTAQLCASSTIAILPALVMGWLSQKSLVKGLTAGAIKG